MLRDLRSAKLCGILSGLILSLYFLSCFIFSFSYYFFKCGGFFK